MKAATLPVIAALALATPAAVAIATPAAALAAQNATVATTTTSAAMFPSARAATASGTTTVMRPLDVASDRAALNAYAAYLTALVKAVPAGETAVNGYETSISTGCRGALASLAESSSDVLNTAAQTTLKTLGEELGDDLSITFDGPALPPFERFSTSLSLLRWSRASGGGAVVRRYLSAESTVLTLSISDLCRDALLAAAAPSSPPLATKALVRLYTKASTSANTSLANLLKLMQTYELPSERALITRIGNLANELTRMTRSYLPTSNSSLLSTLESA